MGVKGRKYKLWWSENSNGTGDVGVLVKEKLCEGCGGAKEERRSDDSSDGT